MKIACQEVLAPGRDCQERFANLKRYGFEAVEVSGEGVIAFNLTRSG